MATRRDEVLDAAIRVLGTGGMRQLTHRAVDAEAGAPAGTTSNHFRSRDALVAGVLDRISGLETGAWERLAATLPARDVDGFAHAVGEFLRQMAGPGRAPTLARQALFVEAAVRPELRARIAAIRAELERWGAPWLRALGSTDPVRHFWLLMDYIDGCLAHQLAAPDPDFDPTPAIRTLLRGMLCRCADDPPG